MIENEKIVKQIQNGENTSDNMLALYMQNKGMIFQIAKKYDSMAEMDDLMQESFLGLCEAVEKYKPDMGVAFSTYAYKVISSHLLRYIRNEKNIPEYLQERIFQYEKLENAFLLQYGRKPKKGEFCHYLGIHERQLRNIEKYRKIRHIESLDAPICENILLADTLESEIDVENNVLDKVQQEQLTSELWKTIENLPDKLPDILKMAYLENMTLQEIGERLGDTRDSIQWQKLKALQMLKQKKNIRSFAEEYIYARAVQGNGVERFRRTWTSSTERVALRLD